MPNRRSWGDKEQWPGQLAVAGAAAWFTGLVILAILDDVDLIPVRIFFCLAGTLSAWGIWRLARTFTNATARAGCRAVAISAIAIGLGFGIGGFGGFIVAYTGLLFATPLAFAVLAIGLMASRDVAIWVKVIPFTLAVFGVVLYGLHAVASEYWDPHDAIWLAILGTGWLLLGFAGVNNEDVRPSNQAMAKPID